MELPELLSKFLEEIDKTFNHKFDDETTMVEAISFLINTSYSQGYEDGYSDGVESQKHN